jgi:hypothetical protein
MKTPQELVQILHDREDSTSAIGVFKEAAGYIKAFREVQQAALDCASAEMKADGVVHTKTDYGTAGWTRPKTARLDKDAWAEVVASDNDLAQLQADADRIAADLETAQRAAGCFKFPEPRFFIK